MEPKGKVQVRTIDGQSLLVNVEADDTVQNLKGHLQQQLKRLPNSESSLRFHLFLKGSKLDVSTPLSSLSFGAGDFLVLVPYTQKKDGKRRKVEKESTEAAQQQQQQHNVPPNQQTIIRQESSSPAELAATEATVAANEIMQPTEAIWHAIVADLAAVSDAVAHESEEEMKNATTLSGRPNSDLNLNGEARPEEQPGSKLPGVSEFLYEELRKKESPEVSAGTPELKEIGKRGREQSSHNVALPPALQRLNRVFIALNAVCGFLQKQHMQATWINVKQALQQLCCFEGEEVAEQDIHVLAALCPRLIVLSNKTTDEEGSSFYIDLFDPSAVKKQEQIGSASVAVATNIEQIGPSDDMPSSVGKRMSDRTIKNAVGRREKAFQKAIAKLIEYLQKNKKGITGGSHEVTIENLMAGAKVLTSEEDKDRALKASLPKPPRAHKNLPRCTNVESLGAVEMLEHLKKGLGSRGQFVHSEHIKSRDAAYGELEQALASEISAALEEMGIRKLYTHQAQAINAAMSGRNVIVATSTASGKSICYNIPVLNDMYQNKESCALYLFPTKALAQDQLRALQVMTKNTEIESTLGVYDGDTPEDRRLMLRATARLIITNPDMLHVSIMPSHRQFNRILSNLRYVVIDEAHAYRGVFGCHTALILRRLRRLCHYLYGTEPTFIVCSATVANPGGHAQELLGLKHIEVVQSDGSPCGDKFFVLWNPPLRFFPRRRRPSKVDTGPATEVVLRQASPIVEVATLLAEMVQHNLRCISFCKSRKLCELVYNYTREILRETAPELVSTIRSYRGGYNAEERRRIESDLFAGKLRGVAATNALELGVDVGGLDATLHLGFPGTVASLWQQSGRAGRREKPSLAVYVAFGGPLDQFFMKIPSRLFSRPIENAQVDSHNQQVVEQHLACAAVEYPLSAGHDDEYFGSGLETSITELVKKGRLGRHAKDAPRDESWHFIGDEKFPSQGVSIRAIDNESYKLINLANDEVIEEVEESKAFFQIYEGAVYMNQGKTYLVKTLNLTTKVAHCQEADLKYYTKTRDFTDVHVTGSELAYPRNINVNKYPSTTALASSCKVTTRWIGFRRIWHGSGDTFDYVDLFLPDIAIDSQAVWIRVPAHIRADLASKELSLRAGLHAANHALVNVMPLYIMCNPSDLGTECANPKDARYFPERLLVYDRHPGGIGIAAQARPMFAELLQAASELIASCECTTDDGCPGCVQTLDCSEYNEVLSKPAAKIIIEGVIQAEDIYRETREQAPPSTDGFLKSQTSSRS